MFSKSILSINTPVSDTLYEYLRSKNNNPFYLFNDQLDYASANDFTESEIIKYNVDQFLSNLLMKPIIKKLSYCNRDD